MRPTIFFPIVAFFLTLTCPCFGQRSTLYLMPSAQFYGFPNLNAQLQAAGFADAATTFGTGAGGYGTINDRWRVGGEGTYFSGARTRGTTTTTSEGGLGAFFVGYQLKRKQWQLVPQAGIGFGGLSVNATRTATASLADLLRTDSNTARIQTGSAFLHTGVSLERIVADGLSLGLKASYNMAFGSTPWRAAGMTQSVSDYFSGFTLNLTIGFHLK